MKLIIDVDDNDYAMLKNTSITLDWNTLWHGKEKDKELTFAIFNLTKAIVDGLPYEERLKGTWIICNQDNEGIHKIECPFCKYTNGTEFGDLFTLTFDKLPPFCEVCGAELMGEEE